MFSNLLYIVAVAICNSSIPVEKCSWIYADDMKRYWIYRPTYELCVEFGKQMIESEGLLKNDDYARIYCLRAEGFSQAKSEVVTQND